jgi:transketolase
MRNAFIERLMALAQDNQDIFLISGDAGFGVLDDYRQMYPRFFINAGVAEANMIGFAAGLSMTGFNVFVYNIIPFLLYRCYEQVRNDICYQRLGVTLIGIGSGLTYAPSGMTHYSVEDVAVASTLPNLTVISPADAVETAAAVEYAAMQDTPVYIRIAKSGEPTIRNDKAIDITQPAIIAEGEKIAVLSYGSVFHEVKQAAEYLADKKILPRLISVPMLRPFPLKRLLELIHDVRALFVVEEHFRSGGLSSSVAEFIVLQQLDMDLIVHALPDKFIHDVCIQAGMRERYGLNARYISQAIESVWRRL